jgi:hypothetical protein
MKRQLAVGFILGLAVAASSHAAPQAVPTVAPNEEQQITVQVHNYARVEPGVLLRAEATASMILKEAGAETIWVACFDRSEGPRDAACANQLGPLDLMVNVLPVSMSQALHRNGDVFGVATEGGKQWFGYDAWIFYDPIESFAADRELSLAQLLGHVLAHELGHLLLGTNSHSRMGLMRGCWSRKELLAADHGELFFSDAESRRIQNGVLARWHAGSRGLLSGEAQRTTEIRLAGEEK